MKPLLPSFPSFWLLALIIVVAFAGAGRAAAVSDDFHTGNDNGWVRYDPLGPLGAGGEGTWSFPSGTYRLQANGAAAPRSTGPARVGSYRTNVYAEFVASVDLVNWASNLDELFGVLGRLRDPGLGTSDGYGFTYDVRASRGGAGQLAILRITDEGSATLASLNMSLVTGHSYRFVFSGRLANLKGELFDLQNPSTPVATLNATDSVYPTGYSGFFVYDNSSSGSNPVDITVDNFYTGPPSASMTIAIDREQGTVTVTWPVWAVSYHLEATAGIGGTWSPIDFNISQDAANFSYVDALAETQYLRLVSP